jgi:hypothetical protein
VTRSNVLFRSLSVMCVLLLCAAPVTVCSGSTPVTTVAHYRVSTRGFTIGDVTTTQRISDERGVTTVNFETKTAVKASFLWMGYHLETVEKGSIQKQELVSYSRKGRENGTTMDIEGRLESSSFRFDVREQGSARTIVIPRNSYDYTTMECPEAMLDFSGTSQITLNILDVEKMAVVKREYKLVKNSNYSVGGKEVPCRIVDFTDRNKKSRRWVAWDGSAVVMYRQDSRGEKNPYSVQATSVNKDF